MINTDVSNKEKTKCYVAVADLKQLGVNSMKCRRDQIERIVRERGCGLLNDSRYFLKSDAPQITPGHLLPKGSCRKVRCCSIEKKFIGDGVLDRLYLGNSACHCDI